MDASVVKKVEEITIDIVRASVRTPRKNIIGISFSHSSITS